MIPEYLTTKQVAELTGKCARQVKRYALAGKIGKDFVTVQLTQGNNGGKRYEFLLESLPEALQAKYWKKEGIDGAINLGIHPDHAEDFAEIIKKTPGTRAVPTKMDLDELELRWLAATDKKKARAQDKLEMVRLVEKLVQGGMMPDMAIDAVTTPPRKLFSRSAVYLWWRLVKGWPRTHHIYVLLDGAKGHTPRIWIHPDYWLCITSNYFRPSAPTLAHVHEEANIWAVKNGIPTYKRKTIARRVAEITQGIHVCSRGGPDAAMQLYPAQERDRSVFHALEAVNADGHSFDVLVVWPDGEEKRVVLTAWQDIRSGKILSYRLTKTENKDSVRLSFGDMVMKYGIPEHAYLDNGRGFASKWLTGGTPTRYRFKVKDEEPSGILTMLGVDVHWATPYHGQAKPIERAFRDLCENIAKSAPLAGAYTGKDTTSKPTNYGSKYIPFEVFEAVVFEGIAKHNARTGRRSKICAGRSFDEAFKESYDTAQAEGKIRIATETQKLFCLMAGDEINPRRNSGELHLFKNRYWAEELVDFRKGTVTVRFDPDQLHEGLWVFTNKGIFICHAPCIMAAGFNDTQAAREHARARNQYLRSQKDQLKALTKMDVGAALMPCVTGTELREMDEESARAASALKESVAKGAMGKKLPKAPPPPPVNDSQIVFKQTLREIVQSAAKGAEELVPVRANPVSAMLKQLQEEVGQ